MLIKEKGRTYFDAADFALSAPDRVTDNGAIQTGREHSRSPHPYTLIPATSSVDNTANEDLLRKSVCPEMSPLLPQTSFKYREPTEEEKPISHEG